MFSGMGSQFPAMGLELYRQHAFFRKRFDELDALCRSLRRPLALDLGRGNLARFAGLASTALAIFVVERALGDTLVNAGLVPDLVVGSSLGLFAAASLAGCLSEEEAICAVADQAQIFERHAEEGAMIAVLAPHDPVLQDPCIQDLAELAAVNFDSSHVLGLPAGAVDAVEARLAEMGVSFQRLDVGRAFHTRWLEPARESFLARFSSISYRRARYPVLCCSRDDATLAVDAETFWSAVRRPIEFSRAILRMERAGAWRYVDVGPSGTLATSLKYLLPATSPSVISTVMTPFGRDGERLRELEQEALS